MNPEELQALLTELVQAVTQVMQSGEVLSDEFQGLLAQTLNNLLTKIDDVGTQQPAISPPTSAPALEPGPYPSSNVNAFKYDPRSGTLFVKFHGKERANSGPTYKYEGVPVNIYDVFAKGRVAPKTSGQNRYHRWIRGVTPSLGASLYALIRNGEFHYERVSG